MSNQATAFGFDVFLRHTNPDGKSYVAQHRAWDKDLFIAGQQQAVADVNTKEKDPSKRKAGVQQITQDQYLKERA